MSASVATRTSTYALLGFVPLIVGLFAAAAFTLTPLPALTRGGTPVGWCGPGYSSDSAAHVLLDPDVVLESAPGEDGGSAVQQAAFRSYCLARAQDRLVYGGVAAAAGGLVGMLACWVVSVRRRPAR